MNIVAGLDFWKNPKNYVGSTSCVKFFMGGYMTDCNIQPKKVAETYGKITFFIVAIVVSFIKRHLIKKIPSLIRHLDWRTHCVKSFQSDENPNRECTVVVIHWGAYACSDFLCLVQFVIRPLGDMLGTIFDRLKPDIRIYLLGHSLAG